MGQALAHGEEGLEGVSDGPLKDHLDQLGGGQSLVRAGLLEGAAAGGVVGPQLVDAQVQAPEGQSVGGQHQGVGGQGLEALD